MPSEGGQLFSAFYLSRLYSTILTSQFGVRVAVLSNTAHVDHPNREVARQSRGENELATKTPGHKGSPSLPLCSFAS